MPIGFEPGGTAIQPYELQRATEDAFVEASALIDQEHDGQGQHTDIHADSIASRDGDPIEVASGLRYTSGPLVLEADGNTLGTAVVAPAQITANQNNYSPAGLATATVLELTSDAARSITGLVQHVRRRRWLWIVNRGNYTLTFAHNSGSSTAVYRFAFSTNGDYALASGGILFLYYDAGSEIWRGQSMPGGVKSLQRGTILISGGATSNTATISAVDMGKTVINHIGHVAESASPASALVKLVLTNTTTITANRFGTDSNVTVGYEAVEYF